MSILIFGGTTEGRILAEKLVRWGVRVTVSVATELGAEELSGIGGISVLIGRRDQTAIAHLLPAFELCIDATHPYAVEATANIAAACEAIGTPLRRLLRPASDAGEAIRVGSCAEAAAFLADKQGNVLLATGAKELGAFAPLEKERLFVRILPTHEGLNACEAMGIPHRNILALQGPFSQKLNEAMMEQYQIAWMVSKDGGRAGGFAEKLAAVQALGAKLVLVGRPEEKGECMDAILREIQEKLS